jgi:hypothetical protein
MADFGHRHFYSGSKILPGVHAVTGEIIIACNYTDWAA